MEQIAISLIGQTIDEMKRDMDMAIEQEANILELRFDALNRAEQTAKNLQALIQYQDILDVYYTNRHISQAGPDPRFGFKGSEEERAELLGVAVDSNVRAADIEAGHELDCNLRNSLYILSCHDFAKTPPYEELNRIYRSMFRDSRGKEPDIIKIATTANCDDDCENMLNLIKSRYDAPKYSWPEFIGLCMGKAGVKTRIKGPVLGSYLTFACLEGKPAAPGQITIRELRKAWESRR